MRVPWIPLLIFLALSLFSDVYIYRCLLTRLKNHIWSKIQLWSAIACYVLLICALMLPRREGDNSMLLTIMWMLYTYASIYFSKYVFVAIDLIGRIPSLFGKHRMKPVSYLAILSGIIVFLAMWWEH